MGVETHQRRWNTQIQCWSDSREEPSPAPYETAKRPTPDSRRERGFGTFAPSGAKIGFCDDGLRVVTPSPKTDRRLGSAHVEHEGEACGILKTVVI